MNKKITSQTHTKNKIKNNEQKTLQTPKNKTITKNEQKKNSIITHIQ